jgi:hypothetical protein
MVRQAHSYFMRYRVITKCGHLKDAEKKREMVLD